MNFLVTPGGSLRGEVEVPGDKSISHRALILSALAEGPSEVTGLLEGDDVLATARALGQVGVKIDITEGQRCRVQGLGLTGLTAPNAPLDLGNSGTGFRLLSAVLAGQSFASVLTGDHSLRKRPMKRIIDPLTLMGATIHSGEGGYPPLKVHGHYPLSSIEYELPIASAQTKSAVLLAGLNANGVTRVREPAQTRDHTENMLIGFGCPLEVGGGVISLCGGARLSGRTFSIPRDFSSAAFFLVGALIGPESELTLPGVGINPTRTGALDILRLMGADIQIMNHRNVAGEPVADLKVVACRLRGVDVPSPLVALAIDEFPVLAIAAACADGKTSITGVGELRIKESDRIRSIVDGLRALDIDVEEYSDGMTITGGHFSAGKVDSCGDHRIAMAFALAGSVSQGPVRVMDCGLVQTSFPGFSDVAQKAGLRLEIESPS
ncbi:MAG: 3-phosphoshikimate 1-carboxyvinyltransferase [Pseudomonadota bacterium]|nr:3-phosphoshikimate 1-carboxyvinyltransferase [Pseudomonadota bacterium]